MAFQGIKALIFDLMGTCTDWHSSLLPALESTPHIPSLDLAKLALDWRLGFFEEIHARFQRQEEQEDIDITHRRVLDRLLDSRGISLQVWNCEVRHGLVQQWHRQISWPDAIPAMNKLRENYFLVVLANGTTRLQLDIIKSTGLPFHSAFSSQLLGFTKPAPEIYKRAIELLQLQPEECLMVAAHAYDLTAAKGVGMKTAYIQRTTEDPGEDMEKVEKENDIFISGTDGSKLCGLGKLVKILQKTK